MASQIAEVRRGGFQVAPKAVTYRNGWVGNGRTPWVSQEEARLDPNWHQPEWVDARPTAAFWCEACSPRFLLGFAITDHMSWCSS